MVTTPAIAQASPRAAFMARYRCPLEAALREIHDKGPVETSRNRFVVLTMRGLFQRYVQCIFTDRDTAMFCEASSAAYETDEFALVRFVPTAETLNTLHRLGFTQEGPKENFSRMVPLGSPPDVRLAADLMLTTLFEAYGARTENDIEMDAPRAGSAHRKCRAPAR